MKRREFLTVAAGYAGMMVAGAQVAPPAPPAAATGPFALPPLPFAENALEPFISARTLSFHYGKHHKTYVDNLNKFTAGTPLAKLTLEEVIKETASDVGKATIFNHAAQVWNHTYFWNSLKPGGGGKPSGSVLTKIEKDFGSFDAFKKTFVETGLAQFGSGWVWLVANQGKLEIASTPNQDSPLMGKAISGIEGAPIFGCDVWEHAYYLKYQNRRADYLKAFWSVVNWAEVAKHHAAVNG